VEFDDSVSTAQAQAAGLAGDISSSYADDVASNNASDFSIGLDPNRISNDMFTNYVNAGSSGVTNVFDLGGGVGDFGFGTTRSQNFLNPELAELYKQQEMARTGINLNKNPYVDSMFTRTFGDLIDRRRDLGSQRIQEINDLRARQAFGLPSLKTGLSYTSKDFEKGRDTNQGMVKELPMGGIERFARSFTPYGAMLPTRAAPERSQMYRDAQAEASAPGILSQTGDFLTDIVNTAERVFSGIFSGKTTSEPFDEVNPNYTVTRVNDFDQFTPSSSKTYEATDRDFEPISNVPISRENVMNPYEENLGMTIEQKGPRTYQFQDFDGRSNFQSEMRGLNPEERNFLTGRSDTISAKNPKELYADASEYIPQSFRGAAEGIGKLFDEDGVPIGPGNLRFQYEPENRRQQLTYTIPFSTA
jgi:hypothetical protein